MLDWSLGISMAIGQMHLASVLYPSSFPAFDGLIVVMHGRKASLRLCNTHRSIKKKQGTFYLHGSEKNRYEFLKNLIYVLSCIYKIYIEKNVIPRE